MIKTSDIQFSKHLHYLLQLDNMSVSISLYELTKKHDLDAYVDQCVEADDVMVKGFQTAIDKLIVDLQKNLPAELKSVRIVKVILLTFFKDTRSSKIKIYKMVATQLSIPVLDCGHYLI